MTRTFHGAVFGTSLRPSCSSTASLIDGCANSVSVVGSPPSSFLNSRCKSKFPDNPVPSATLPQRVAIGIRTFQAGFKRAVLSRQLEGIDRLVSCLPVGSKQDRFLS